MAMTMMTAGSGNARKLAASSVPTSSTRTNTLSSVHNTTCNRCTMAAAATVYIDEEEEHVCDDADDDSGLQQHAQVARELGSDHAHAGGHLVLHPQHVIDYADLNVPFTIVAANGVEEGRKSRVASLRALRA
jgi:citrate lyase beta subunit